MKGAEQQQPADLFTACGQQAITIDGGWRLTAHPARRARCNRPRHHEGPHREVDPRTFETRAEFVAVYVPPSARWQ